MTSSGFEPMITSVADHLNESIEREPQQRPPWRWILREKIEPLCVEYRLDIEYGEEEEESCAIFYDGERL